MAYLLINCFAKFWDTETNFFNAVDDELKKHFSHMYPATYSEEHKHLILISYDEVISTEVLFEKLEKLRLELKYIQNSFKGDISISILGEALWIPKL